MFAQPADQAVTASASRTITIAPDEAVYQIAVSAGFGTSLEVLLNMLRPVGVREEHLVGLSASSSSIIAVGPELLGPREPVINWQFLLTTPAAAFRETVDRLEAVRSRRPEGVLSLDFSASLAASGRSVEQARQPVLAELIAEARRKAEALARASGFSLGPILLISEGLSPTASPLGIVGGLVPGEPSSIRVTLTVNLRFGRS